MKYVFLWAMRLTTIVPIVLLSLPVRTSVLVWLTLLASTAGLWVCVDYFTIIICKSDKRHEAPDEHD